MSSPSTPGSCRLPVTSSPATTKVLARTFPTALSLNPPRSAPRHVMGHYGYAVANSR